MVDSYSVKGSVLQSKLDGYERVCGEAAVRDLRQSMAGSLPRLLNPLDWYPFALLTEMLEVMRVEGLGGKIENLSKVGAETARILLSSTYRPLTNAGDWRTFMSTASRLHSQYYNVGQMAVTFDEGVCRVELTGAPSYDHGDLHVAGGFYTGSAQHFGISARYAVRITGRCGHIEVSHS